MMDAGRKTQDVEKRQLDVFDEVTVVRRAKDVRDDDIKEKSDGSDVSGIYTAGTVLDVTKSVMDSDASMDVSHS